MTIYLPDDLAAEIKEELGDTNISAICQTVLRDELSRRKARAEVTAKGFERIEVPDDKKGRDVAFQGRRIAAADDQEAYLTPKGAIVVVGASDNTMVVFDDWDDLTEPVQGIVISQWPTEDLMVQIADALGKKYTEELDI